MVQRMESIIWIDGTAPLSPIDLHSATGYFG